MAGQLEDDIRSLPRPAATTSIPNNATSGPKPAASLDRNNATTTRPKPAGTVQPKPQALPKRSGPSAIIVSPRQKGNPILNQIKGLPWEYGDIVADYVLGATTCALFLSLKYHGLHPEYVYARMKSLQGKYLLRILLVLVDIANHEESLKELSKTSIPNNVTLILCWSAAEGGRYLELFKTYENAAPTAIKQRQSTSYSDRMIDFITKPRSINKTDAVSLVSQFGTIRTAVNARHEDVEPIANWGQVKVKQWCAAVQEPFRIQRTARRVLDHEAQLHSLPISMPRADTRAESHSPAPDGSLRAGPLRRSTTPASSRPTSAAGELERRKRPHSRLADDGEVDDDIVEGEMAPTEAITASKDTPQSLREALAKKRKQDDDPLSSGVMSALSKLRKEGG